MAHYPNKLLPAVKIKKIEVVDVLLTDNQFNYGKFGFRPDIQGLKFGDTADIISTGVGPQKTGDPIKDAVAAVKAGADHLVIGRALINAENPVAQGKRIFEAIKKAHEKR